MKKLLLLAAMIALPSMVMAQGFVVFANTTTTLIRTNVGNGTIVGSTDGVNQWNFGLYVAPAGTTDPSAFTQVGQTTNRSGAFRGQFTGGNPYQIAAPNGPIGTTIAFQVRGWSANFATYDSAFAARTSTGWVGTSALGSVSPSGSTGPFPALFGTNPGQVGGFDIFAPVPEPSSIALGLLGLGAIALFRRRSSK